MDESPPDRNPANLDAMARALLVFLFGVISVSALVSALVAGRNRRPSDAQCVNAGRAIAAVLIDRRREFGSWPSVAESKRLAQSQISFFDPEVHRLQVLTARPPRSQPTPIPILEVLADPSGTVTFYTEASAAAMKWGDDRELTWIAPQHRDVDGASLMIRLHAVRAD